MKKLFSTIVTLCCLLFSGLVVASPAKENVNVLTWWAYLDNPEIVSYVEKQCDVKLTFDEYYSNDEFLHRWEAHRDYYDVIIFSDTIYNLVKDKIPHLANSNLWRNSDEYHPAIKNHYLKRHYPKNIAYFLHSMSGFLWNPNNISLAATDTVSDIFKKVGNKYVVIMDDPSEAKRLVESNGSREFSIDNFKKMAQQASVFVTNDYSQIYNKPEFAFSYGWSGEAVVDLLASNKNYKFLVHPKLSHISSDLIAMTSSRHKSACVSKMLSSRKVLNLVQNKEFYFTPYVSDRSAKNKFFLELYAMFKKALTKDLWSDSVKMENFRSNNKEWQLIKIELNNVNRGV